METTPTWHIWDGDASLDLEIPGYGIRISAWRDGYCFQVSQGSIDFEDLPGEWDFVYEDPNLDRLLSRTDALIRAFDIDVLFNIPEIPKDYLARFKVAAARERATSNRSTKA